MIETILSHMERRSTNAPLAIDPAKLGSVTYLLNGLNLFASLYFSIKSIHIALIRRKFFWYLLVATHVTLFMSMAQTFADPLIFEGCKGGKFGCLTYGLFYVFVTSVGYYRLWVLSRQKKVYLFFWALCVVMIVGSYIWMCFGSIHHYFPFICQPEVDAFRELLVAIAEISTAFLLIACHGFEIWSFHRITHFTSAAKAPQANTIGGYFRDTIWCIVPAAIVTFGCKIASIFADKGKSFLQVHVAGKQPSYPNIFAHTLATFLMIIMLQSVVEDTLMYEASVLLVRYGTGTTHGSTPGSTGLSSTHSHHDRSDRDNYRRDNGNGTFRTVDNISSPTSPSGGSRPGYFWSGNDEKDEYDGYNQGNKTPTSINLPTYSMRSADLYPPTPGGEREARYKRSNSIDQSHHQAPPSSYTVVNAQKPVNGNYPPVRTPSVPNLTDLPYPRDRDGGRYHDERDGRGRGEDRGMSPPRSRSRQREYDYDPNVQGAGTPRMPGRMEGSDVGRGDGGRRYYD
ncbi:hypothetical protein HK097_005262 [Rhizophlyctis rosea]|uniref:Uncharacterized protein n=1 Tax=Rhizophlyctis rosea TaxID=64517 RepID=A0AAD5SFC7_9FUNG|nr:hypothetical protein HK097_005262 [Rhizophlyctis rosea]